MFVDTRNQVADDLTNGHCPSYEWYHLLRFFNIMNITVFSRSQLAKRFEETLSCYVEAADGNKRQGEDEERVVCKIAAGANFRRFGPQSVFHRTESKFYSAQPCESWSKLCSFGLIENGETHGVNSNASDASSSPLWPADAGTNPSTDRPVAKPTVRCTMKELAQYNFAVLPHTKCRQSLRQRTAEARPPRGRQTGATRR